MSEHTSVGGDVLAAVPRGTPKGEAEGEVLKGPGGRRALKDW